MVLKAAPQPRQLYFWILRLLALTAFLVALTLPPSLIKQGAPGGSSVGNRRADFDKLPIAFESNAGQADELVRFIAHTSGAALAFYQDQVLINLKAPAQDKDGTNTFYPNCQTPARH